MVWHKCPSSNSHTHMGTASWDSHGRKSADSVKQFPHPKYWFIWPLTPQAPGLNSSTHCPPKPTHDPQGVDSPTQINEFVAVVATICNFHRPRPPSAFGSSSALTHIGRCVWFPTPLCSKMPFKIKNLRCHDLVCLLAQTHICAESFVLCSISWAC